MGKDKVEKRSETKLEVAKAKGGGGPTDTTPNGERTSKFMALNCKLGPNPKGTTMERERETAVRRNA